MLRSKDDSPQQATPSRVFAGVRFILLGFHPTEAANARSKLLSGGGVDAGEYGPRCTHLIVDNIVYDDSECVVARNDGKTVVAALWVEHCLDVGMLVDTSSILYRPVKDLNGIPGAKSLSICLTGYQRQDRDDIMRMVGLMGAYFSKPLVANKVTHLICYKFEGEKYELAKKLKKIKLINHRWLEDCLRAWEILPECNYNKSGYELEMMEAEAKDSEEEIEDDKNYKVFGGNVAGGPSNLHSGSGVTISKGSEMSFPIDKDEAAKKILSDKMQDIVNGKRLVNSPRKAAGNEDISKLQEVNRNQGELTGKGTQTYDKAIGSKQSSELSSNPITARMSLPSDAMTPDALSYSRKIPRRSPASKFSGMLSSDVHGTPNGVSEPYNVKDGFDASPPKLEQFKDNTDFGFARNPVSDSKLQFEGGSTRPQKRKISLSNVSSKSPRKDANSKTYATGSPSVRGNNDGLLINRPDIVSSSHGIGDNRAEKNDVQSSGSNRSVNIPKIKSLSVENSSLNHGMTFSRTPISDATKFPSDLKMSEKTPETSGLVKLSTMDAKNEDKEMCSLTHLQSDDITDPGVDQQNTMVSSLRSGNCENGKPASPVDLGADNGSKNETFSRSLTKKKVVKKSLGSKSKLSSGNSKQKGSLCLNKKSIFDDDMFSKEKGKEAEHGRTLGVGDEMADQAIPVEPVIENKVAENTSSENKVEIGVAVEDDETEAPEEDTGAELVNAASEEIVKSVPQANAARETKLEVELSSAIKMKRDVVHRKNTTVISEKVEPKAAVGGTKIDEVGGLILNEEMFKGKNNVSSKRKKNAAAVVKKTEKSGKDKVAELKKTIDDAKMEVKKKTGAQRPASKLKSKSISLDVTEVPMNGENDDKLVEKKDLMQVKNYSSSKGMKTLQPDVEKAEVIAKNKMGELAKGIDEGTPETENVKMVPHPATKPKSKTASVVKAQKRKEEEEKENKSVETGSVVANSVKPKESIGTKLNRALTQTNNSVYGTKVDQKKSGRASKVVKPDPMCFILSGHRLQRKEFQKIIRCMKGRVCRDSHNWSYEATHFIVPDPIRRTEKFFAAAASGRWILKTDYLTASNQEGKFLPEEPYEWFKKGFSEDGAINLEAPRKWRLLRERTGHGAFYGMKIIIYGECIAPPLDTLKRAVKGGDGVILATAPPYTRYLKSGVDFAVVCPGMPCVDSWVQEFLRHEIPCISADYLVEYVCKPGCSLERHVLFKTEAWADKSYANMLSRSEEIVEDMASVEDDDQDQDQDQDQDRNENSGSDDISCQICGSRERAEVMLICGDETGSSGCGIGTHIDCCDPPLGAVPAEDWFCPNCIEAKNSTRPRKKTKKGSGSSKRK